MATPDFVVVGHVVRDLVPDGWRLGGTAMFAAVQAKKLGLRVGIVTCVDDDMELGPQLSGVSVVGRPSSHTTTFENTYKEGRRRQRVHTRADQISTGDVPDEWRKVPAVLVGPVAGDVACDVTAGFTSSLVGVSAQGWLRSVGRDGSVTRRAWDGEPFWRGADVLFVSDEDLGGRTDQLDRWTDEVSVVAVTQQKHGARVWSEGRWRNIAGIPSDEVDPTGAGDVFATAFLVRYQETKDASIASRFASAAAAWVVEGLGVESIAEREKIERRMKQHPEVALQ